MSNSSWMQTCVICEKAQVLISGNRTCDSFQCRNEYQHWLQSRKPVCAICGKRIWTASSANPVCGDTDCTMRWVALTRAGDQCALARCQICGVFTIRQSDQKCVCRDSGCMVLQSIAQRKEQQRIALEKFKAMVAAAELIRDRKAGESSGGNRAGHLVAIVPHTSAPMGPPNPESVANYRRRLEELTHTAFTDSEQESDWPYRTSELPNLASKTELPIFDQACTACRGHCCHMGGDHAFQSVSTIRRYMSRHPDATPGDVINAYLEQLPEQSLVDSCVFHTDRGCNMSREMRADMCNHFICRGLKGVREDIQDKAPGFFVVSEQDGEFFDTRFVDVRKSEPD